MSDCGGVYEASAKLDVPSFFIDQILRDEPVPDHILDRIEQEVGLIRLTERIPNLSNNISSQRQKETLKAGAETEISLEEFVRNCGGLLATSLKLGVSISTLQKILSRSPVSAPTVKKILTALNAMGCSIASEHSDSPLRDLRSSFERPELPKSRARQGGVYPSTVQKVQKGLPISKATRRKLGISLEEGTALFTPDTARTNPVAVLVSRLREIIKSDVDIFDFASKWGVTETSLKKICEGKAVTRALIKKLELALDQPDQRVLPIRPSTAIERLRTIHNLYGQLGTLEAVGKQVGLTRERVRQLLTKGKKIGLFEYNPREYPFVSKEKLVDDFKKALSLSRIARLNNISTAYLHKLFTAYSITEKELTSYRLEARRAKCIEQFRTIAESIGHHPSSTELQRVGKGRALYNRIVRYWGSIDNFRAQLSIPKPRYIRPHWLDSWRQIALVKRMQHLDTLRDCMSTFTPVGVSELCQRSNFGPNRVRRLLALLMATGEVKRIGQLTNTKYLLAKTEVA